MPGVQNRILVDKLEILAGKKSCTTGQLALAWLLHKDPHVIPLFGTKTIKNLEANIAAADVALSAEEFQEIDTCFAPSQVIFHPKLGSPSFLGDENGCACCDA